MNVYLPDAINTVSGRLVSLQPCSSFCDQTVCACMCLTRCPEVFVEVLARVRWEPSVGHSPHCPQPHWYSNKRGPPDRPLYSTSKVKHTASARLFPAWLLHRLQGNASCNIHIQHRLCFSVNEGSAVCLLALRIFSTERLRRVAIPQLKYTLLPQKWTVTVVHYIHSLKF